jgi:hypothetical protein
MSDSNRAGKIRILLKVGLILILVATTAASCDPRADWLQTNRELCETVYQLWTEQGSERAKLTNNEPAEPEELRFPAPYIVLYKKHDEKVFAYESDIMGWQTATENLKTLVCIKEDWYDVGRYTSGGKASRYRWDVAILEWPDGEVIYAQAFHGSAPPQQTTGFSASGTKPEEEFKLWLEIVFREQL